LENNLFGVDLNEESVEIAKLSLWLRTAQPNRKLNDLSGNIKCGNSLIDDPEIAGEKAFNWQNAFPKVFENGGFDVIIGNPPYVLCQPSNTNEKTLDYYKKFEVASYKIDLFHLFFEKSISILNGKGLLGFITPNTYLMNKYIQKLRKFILENTTIELIVNYEDSVFGKRMINQIDASIAALDVLKDNEDNKDLVAIVSISKNKDDKFRNAIILSKVDKGEQPDEVLHGSCKVCGIRSAYACLEKIQDDDSLGNEFDVHVKRLDDGCVAVSW
jgi:type I restriction-modification system DNA methylase subunit